MAFEETKVKMESMGFRFEWCDEDIEGTEEDEETGREREVTVHAKGWWMFHPPDYNYPRIFIPNDDPHQEGYLNVALERYEKRHDAEEEGTRMMKRFQERFEKRREERCKQ